MKDVGEAIKRALLPELDRLAHRHESIMARVAEHDRCMEGLGTRMEALGTRMEASDRERREQHLALMKDMEERRQADRMEIEKRRRADLKEIEERREADRRQNEERLAAIRKESADHRRAHARWLSWIDENGRRAREELAAISGHLDWGRRIARIERRIDKDIIPVLKQISGR